MGAERTLSGLCFVCFISCLWIVGLLIRRGDAGILSTPWTIHPSVGHLYLLFLSLVDHCGRSGKIVRARRERDDDGETVFSGHKSAANLKSQQILQHTQELHEFKIEKIPALKWKMSPESHP